MQAKAALLRVTKTGTAEQIGCASMFDGERGLRLRVSAKGLPEGRHGMHVHEGASCGPGWSESDKAVIPAGAAGPHYDPQATHAHLGPGGGGQAGDMPRFRSSGTQKNTRYYTIPGLTVTELLGRTFVIHQDGDNFSDTPKPNGGAGPRFMCGTIRPVLRGSRYPGVTSATLPASGAVAHTQQQETRPYLCVAYDTEKAAIQPLRLAAGLAGGPLVGYAAWSLRQERPALATGLGVVAAAMSAWSLYVWGKADAEMRQNTQNNLTRTERER
jgi:Cu-Zn family superoxide dismutase